MLCGLQVFPDITSHCFLHLPHLYSVCRCGYICPKTAKFLKGFCKSSLLYAGAGVGVIPEASKTLLNGYLKTDPPYPGANNTFAGTTFSCGACCVPDPEYICGAYCPEALGCVNPPDESYCQGSSDYRGSGGGMSNGFICGGGFPGCATISTEIPCTIPG